MIPFLPFIITNSNKDNSAENAIQPFPITGYSVLVYLAIPVAGLALLWGRKDILSRIHQQWDKNCLSVFCPSFSKREKLTKWACGRLPLTWSSQTRTLSGGIYDLWSDGSLLCTLINSAVPGACHNPHKHWKKPPLHAQAIAYKYLGVVPQFVDDDFKDEFSISHEAKFIHYLNELKLAITQLAAKQNEDVSYTNKYVVRGMGLSTAEQYRKSTFYIYENNNSHTISNVLVHLRGPYHTFGEAKIQKLHKHKIDIKLTKPNKQELVLEDSSEGIISSILSFFKKPESNKDDKSGNDIPIRIILEEKRAKVEYIPKNYGVYEISLIANGELLKGCPFIVQVAKNTSGVEEGFEDVEIKKEFKIKQIGIVAGSVKKVQELNQNKPSSLELKNDKIELKPDFDNKESKEPEVKIDKVVEDLNDVKKKPLLQKQNKIDEENEENKTDPNLELEEKCPNSEVISDPLGTVEEVSKIYDETSKKFKIVKKEHKPLTKVPSISNVKKIEPILGKYESNNPKFKSNISLDTFEIPSLDLNNNHDKEELKTSTLCPDHTVQEVINTYKTLPVAQKRKLFQNQATSNSSLSDLETEAVPVQKPSLNQNLFENSVSLPNISPPDEEFQKKRAFWENLSNQSNHIPNIKRQITKGLYKGEYQSLVDLPSSFTKNPKETQSLVDIPSSCTEKMEIKTNSFFRTVPRRSSLKQLKSTDNSLNKCDILSIEERKKILLKQNYEKEKIKSKIIKDSLIKDQTQLSDKKERKPEKKEASLKFKKIAAFFKTLENKQEGKVSVLERFSLKSVYYEVVIGKGSFKGIPNSRKVAEGLATFPKAKPNETSNENEIDLSLFKFKRKVKQRKSLGSVFNITY